MGKFEKELKDKAKNKGYIGHFKGPYLLLGGFGWVTLAVSALMSAKFFSAIFADLGDYAVWVGGFASLLLGIVIAVITEGVLAQYQHAKEVETPLAIILACALLLNIYGDLDGANLWAEDFTGTAPVDEKTAGVAGTFTPQIADIDKRIDELEAEHFYWCATHKARHKCEFAQKWIEPKNDAPIVAQIKALQARKDKLVADMAELTKEASTAHLNALEGHASKLEENKNRLRGVSIVATAFYLLITWWRHSYLHRATKGIKKAKKGKRRKTKRTPAESASTQAEQAYRELLKEHSDLREEIRAREEAEARGK